MRNKVILLVEDNPDDVELTLRAFDKHRIANEIIVARDGLEALDVLLGTGAHAGRTAQPELVLLDVNLPKLSGLEVLRRIRADARIRRTPVVMLTSSLAEQDVFRSYDLGANSFVQKPVDFEQFLEAARQLGLYWLVLNEAPQR
jgi:two-component system response regulator